MNQCNNFTNKILAASVYCLNKQLKIYNFIAFCYDFTHLNKEIHQIKGK